MKDTFEVFYFFYLVIGALLGTVMEISYVYTLFYAFYHLGFAVFSWEGLFAIVIIIFSMAVWPLIQGILWGPSLVIWIFWDQGTTFLRWLAPGFYVTIG